MTLKYGNEMIYKSEIYFDEETNLTQEEIKASQMDEMWAQRERETSYSIEELEEFDYLFETNIPVN